MSLADALCHALRGIRSAARAGTFHRQDTVSENQGRKGRDDAIDPEAGREIPRGSDEESNGERSNVGRDESPRRSTSPPQRSDEDRQTGA